MANVTPTDVKKLRDKTGAGMLDCKNALIEAEGDFANAEKILKEKGLASADKRSGRATNQGSVFTKIENGKAAMVELTCETDFVAKNEMFRKAGDDLVAMVLAEGLTEVNEALSNRVKEAISVLKENMTLRTIKLTTYKENETVAAYHHNGGEIGVLVKLTCDSKATADNEAMKALAFDLALHAAAFNPLYMDKDSVDATYLKEQEEIFTTQAKDLGKPEKIALGIAKGKLNKHLAQICFAEQGFVKEDKVPVKDKISAVAKEAGGEAKLSQFIYVMVGQEV